MSTESWEFTYEDYKREFTEAALINNDENVTARSMTSWLPRKCYLSGKKLWRKEAIVLLRIVPTGGARIKETYWIDPREYTLAVLRWKK